MSGMYFTAFQLSSVVKANFSSHWNIYATNSLSEITYKALCLPL